MNHDEVAFGFLKLVHSSFKPLGCYETLYKKVSNGGSKKAGSKFLTDVNLSLNFDLLCGDVGTMSSTFKCDP